MQPFHSLPAALSNLSVRPRAMNIRQETSSLWGRRWPAAADACQRVSLVRCYRWLSRKYGDEPPGALDSAASRYGGLHRLLCCVELARSPGPTVSPTLSAIGDRGWAAGG